MSTGDAEVDPRLAEWLAWDKNPITKAEIESLVSCQNVSELRSRLCTRMQFGTAGLRARMGAGNSMMNDLTIIQTTQGFVKYMEKICPNLKERGVVIGYDARHNSRKWAGIIAAVLTNRGIKVYLFSQICPTPFVPFSVLKYGTDWGIMVTASHNPKEDNGYKVYYSNGAQIISPHDKGIASSIMENLAPWETSWDTSVLSENPLVNDPYASVLRDYMSDIKGLCHFSEKNAATPLNFTYSAMHGVGYTFIKEAFRTFNFKPPIPVKEQVDPDPEFPTVTFPNPEEGKSALNLAMKTADENNSTLIFANDPDADRLAVAEKQPDGQWYIFNGNELGALFCWWIWSRYQAIFPNSAGSDAYCLSSTVSSKILRTIALKEGFNFEETLTGFKWMGNRAFQLMQEGKTTLFAFEEAIGFMCGTVVLDKDGISACVVGAEMAVYLAERGLTFKQQLDEIYKKYGDHISRVSYFICHDPKTIVRMFDRLRDYEGTGKYPASCGRYGISNIRDLTTGYDSQQPDHKAILPTSKSSQMITFYFENGCEITMRTSGTEPKIKYYAELIADPNKGLDRETLNAELDDMVKNLIDKFFEPEKNHLIARNS